MPGNQETASERKSRLAKAAEAKAKAAERAAKLKQAANTRTRGHASGFVDFIREQGVVGLAIGLILGVQAKAIVDQMVASFVNPTLGLIMPGKGGLEAKTFSVSLGDKAATFGYGAFISVFISFLVVAGLVYFVFKVLKLDKLDKKKG